MKRAILIFFILTLFVAPVWVSANEPFSGEAIVENSGSTVIIKPVDSNGVASGKIDIGSIDERITAAIGIENTNIEKIIEIAPESKLVISEDGESVKQGKGSSVEIYYGYQKSYYQSWTDYARVDSCVDGVCKVVLANFIEKRVWIEYKSESEIFGISTSDTIPDFGEMSG